jgi:hypothetical protein
MHWSYSEEEDSYKEEGDMVEAIKELKLSNDNPPQCGVSRNFQVGGQIERACNDHIAR